MLDTDPPGRRVGILGFGMHLVEKDITRKLRAILSCLQKPRATRTHLLLHHNVASTCSASNMDTVALLGLPAHPR